MKKIALIGVAALVVLAAAGFVVFRTISAKEASARPVLQVSPQASNSLQKKIDRIKAAEDDTRHERGTSHVELSEVELESYLLYSLKEDIPAKIDSADVQIEVDTISLDTQITFDQNATGNPVVDALVGGTHNLFVKGKLAGHNARGKFDLQEVRVDSIPIPKAFIQALIKKYVKPKYPEVDLDEPFDIPYGIQELKLEPGKAQIVY